MEDALERLIDLVEETAPALWEIGRRQAMVDGVRELIFAALIVVAIIAAVSWLRSLWQTIRSEDRDRYDEPDESTGWLANFVVGGCCVIGAFIASGMLYTALGYLLNPDYYALQVLIGLVK